MIKIKTYSARRLGDRIGLSARDVNKKLFELGLLDGKPGLWTITEKGKEFGDSKFIKTGQRNGSATGYDLITWKGTVLNMLGNAKKHMKTVDKNRKMFGFKPIDWEKE